MTKGDASRVAVLAALLCPVGARAGVLKDSYVDPGYLTDVAPEEHSHWAQPWRAYLETVPASTFVRGLGINLKLSNRENPALVCRMLAAHGIRNARIEIGWGQLSYQTESLVDDSLAALLSSCKASGIRPLIVLNARSGAPCPMKTTERIVTAPAPKGAWDLQLNEGDDLSLSFSGLSDLTQPWAAQVRLTSISGSETLALSKQLPIALDLGAKVKVTSLAYSPFGPPNTLEFLQTIDGWRRYVLTVAAFVAGAMKGSDGSDQGFDLEIWDELGSDSHFLYINDYYDSPWFTYDEQGIWAMLVAATADLAYAAALTGVRFVDGFGGTERSIASPLEPASVSGLSRHPILTRESYPADEPPGTGLNALYEPDTWVPGYSALFPEHDATMLQAGAVIRDMAPITTRVNGTSHGRNARVLAAGISPVPVWITRIGVSPEDNGVVDPAAAAALKARVATRSAAFYIGKGAERVVLFDAAGGDLGSGMLLDAFMAYARTATAYPSSDAPYTSLALSALGSMVDHIGQGMDDSVTPETARRLTIKALGDAHDHVQFEGDGTPQHAPLYDREVLALLPFQANSHRFVIAYYVMTRDVTKTLAPEKFTVSIGGLDGRGALVVTAHDPIADERVAVTVLSATADALAVEITAADHPYLLTVQEDPSAAASVDGGSDAHPDGAVGDGAADERGGLAAASSSGCGCTTGAGPAPVALVLALAEWMRRRTRAVSRRGGRSP